MPPLPLSVHGPQSRRLNNRQAIQQLLPSVVRYDRPDTLYYLDPPYFGVEGYYGKELFCRDDFERLAGILNGLKGQFILSLNDCPEVREIFAGHHMVNVETTYSVQGQGNASKASELIITNTNPA